MKLQVNLIFFCLISGAFDLTQQKLTSPDLRLSPYILDPSLSTSHPFTLTDSNWASYHRCKSNIHRLIVSNRRLLEGFEDPKCVLESSSFPLLDSSKDTNALRNSPDSSSTLVTKAVKEELSLALRLVTASPGGPSTLAKVQDAPSAAARAEVSVPYVSLCSFFFFVKVGNRSQKTTESCF